MSSTMMHTGENCCPDDTPAVFHVERPSDRIAKRRREIPRYKRDQEALADDVGVSRQQVSRWENGSSMPTGENLSALARALGVSPDWILHGERPDYITPEDVAEMGQRVAESGSAYEPASAPQQLLDFLSQRLGHRRVAGELTDKDLIAAAYTLARKHGFSAEDYRLLDRWRDQIIQGEKG